MTAFVILCDGAVDQICEDARSKDSEVRDLRKMGFDVSVKRFASMELAEAYTDKKRGY